MYEKMVVQKIDVKTMGFEVMQFRHEWSLDIRWGDMDAYGHVNNALYFRYFESARFRYFEDVCWQAFGGKMPVAVLADIRCQFKKELIYPATLVIKTAVSQMGNSSFCVVSEIWSDESCCARAESVMVWLDEVSHKPCRIPEAVRAVIAAYEGLSD